VRCTFLPIYAIKLLQILLQLCCFRFKWFLFREMIFASTKIGLQFTGRTIIISEQMVQRTQIFVAS